MWSYETLVANRDLLSKAISIARAVENHFHHRFDMQYSFEMSHYNYKDIKNPRDVEVLYVKVHQNVSYALYLADILRASRSQLEKERLVKEIVESVKGNMELYGYEW